VKLLIETDKVDVDSKDNDGQTPLSLAAMNGHEAAAKLLLKHAAKFHLHGEPCQSLAVAATLSVNISVTKSILATRNRLFVCLIRSGYSRLPYEPSLESDLTYKTIRCLYSE
jgi:ankyrin repeat protein